MLMFCKRLYNQDLFICLFTGCFERSENIQK